MKDVYALKEGAAAKLLSAAPGRGGIWQADAFSSPIPLREGVKALRPATSLVVDADSGFIFQSGVQNAPVIDVLGDAVLEAMNSHWQIPAILKIKPALAPKLSVFSQVFGLRIEPETQMTALIRARRSMERAFKKWQSARTHARYPAATFSVYGPDDLTATKLVVGVVSTPDQSGPEELMTWEEPGVLSDPQVIKEVESHLVGHGARAVVATRNIIGCPHQEGKDFPIGGDCPGCPFWAGKQGSGAPERDFDAEVLDLPVFFTRWKGSR